MSGSRVKILSKKTDNDRSIKLPSGMKILKHRINGTVILIPDSFKLLSHENNRRVYNRNAYALFDGHSTFAVSSDGVDYKILCINLLGITSGNVKYHMLTIDASGTHEDTLDVSGKNRPEIARIKKTLECNNKYVIHITNPLIYMIIPTIDKFYGCNVDHLIIAVVHYNYRITRSRDDLLKIEDTPKFIKFCGIIGKEQSFKFWDPPGGGYSADDVGVTNVHRGTLPVVYHIGTSNWMTEDTFRQLIGNDMLLIVFVDNDIDDTIVDLSLLSEMGSMTQCVAIVTPVGDKYSVRFVFRNDILSTNIHVTNDLLDPWNMLDNMIMNMYNAMNNIRSSIVFGKMYSRPRQDYINRIVNNTNTHVNRHSTGLKMKRGSISIPGTPSDQHIHITPTSGERIRSSDDISPPDTHRQHIQRSHGSRTPSPHNNHSVPIGKSKSHDGLPYSILEKMNK